jgi:NADPH:quinone reductase-like Zn-dependent oxidoreductase
MKAYEVHEFGIDRLSLVERPEPAAGEGEVVVSMRAWSLNFRDLMIVRGEYNPKMRRPIVPLSDGAGEVVAVGPGVTRVKVGDRVIGAFMQKWIDGDPDETALRSALGGAIDGVAAEYVVLHENGLLHIPEYLSWEEAAALPCAAVTAWHALVSEGHVRPAEWVLTQGTGGVSLFALQFAKIMRARVIATSSRDEKLDRVRAMGADEGVNYSANPDWDKVAREITKGRGVDHIVEVGGEGTLPKSMRAVRPGGSIYVIGVLSGRGEIGFIPLFMRNLRLQGIFVGSRVMAEDMLRAMEAHQLRPTIDRVFGFSEVREALRYLEQGQHFGKVCLRAG